MPNIESCYYKTLGVDRKASIQDIGEAYTTLSKDWVDEDGQEADKYNQHLIKAYQTLNDHYQRKQYDEEHLGEEELKKEKSHKWKYIMGGTATAALGYALFREPNKAYKNDEPLKDDEPN